MYRLLKVFGQANLSDLLKANEIDVYASQNFMSSSPKKHQPTANGFSTSPGHLHRSAGSDVMNEWGSYRADAFLQDDCYVCMFGAEVRLQIGHIVEKMLVTREVETERAAHLAREQRLRYKGFRKYLKWFFVNDDDAVYEQILSDCRKIPDILNNMLHTMATVFEVGLECKLSVLNDENKCKN